LNPHFLFNVLNSVISLVRREPATAEQALIDLSMMLRYALSSHSDSLDDEVSLKEEWRFTENYLALEKLRLGRRLQVESSIDPDTLSLDLPALTIQPLVENAVRHGISPRPTGGKISISAQSRDGVLMIEIADDGLGALQEDLDTEKGVGLRTVRRRLELHYKNQATMKVDTSPDCGFRVQLHLPQDDARVLV
jgi:sensor histidine kinase YesM